MAEITKPIALNESFNTTEGSPRNVADVLAQGIGDLVTVVSRISHQTTYDELSDLEDVNISAPTNGDVLTYDGSKWVNGQVGGGSVEQMIAPVETSTTASQAYAIGEQFILNGTLYTATAAITAGGTIVINGNCTASDTVTEQIDALINSATVTPISPNSLIQNSIAKVGNLVAGNVRIGATANANTETQIATIDNPPTDTIYCDAFKTGDYTKGIAIIYTNGKINITFPTALSGTGIAFTFAYRTNS